MLTLEGLKKFEQDSKLVKRLLFLEVEWRRSCPDVDLQAQLGWAHYWVTTNSKGAGRKDMVRFISNWFKRCQEDLSQKKQWNKRVTERFVEPKPDGEVMSGDDFKKMKEALRETKRTTS